MRRVLVLDIDGVLNSARYMERMSDQGILVFDEAPHRQFDPAAVARLNRVVAVVDPLVIVSSVWRLSHPLDRLERLMQRAGYQGRLHGVTPSHAEGCRGSEVAEWLTWFPAETYALVDDDVDPGWHEGRWVQTSWRDGMQDEHADALIRLLGTKEEA